MSITERIEKVAEFLARLINFLKTLFEAFKKDEGEEETTGTV